MQTTEQMSLTNLILASYKHRQHLSQERAVAKKLGVEPTALSNYRKGERRMPDTAIATLADGMDVPLGDMVAAINIGMVNTDEKQREFWLKRITKDSFRQFATTYSESFNPSSPRKEPVKESRQNQG